MNYHNGDILRSSETLIIHGCNARGVMGAGIAKQIRAEYPEVFDVYHEYIKCFANPEHAVGTVLPVYASDGRVIVNMITQLDYGSKGVFASRKSVYHCLVRVAELFKNTPIGSPLVASGLGGLDWKRQVEPIYEQVEDMYGVEFNIYRLD